MTETTPDQTTPHATTPDQTPILNRVKRAQGQLAGVLRMIEEGRDLESVLNQLKAVSSALDRAGFAMVAAEWKRTSAELDDDEVARLEKLFLSLG